MVIAIFVVKLSNNEQAVKNIRASFELGKTTNNVVRVTVSSPDFYFNSNEI